MALSLEEVLDHLGAEPLASDALTLLSGGAEGVDSLFDTLMASHSSHTRCLHWSFDGHRDFKARPEFRVNLPDAFAAAIADPRLEVAASRLRQSMPRNQFVKALFRRNIFQVLWADAVYAITWEDLNARYPLRIGGGTKWAAQAYIDRFQPLGPEPSEACQLFFYEVNSRTWRQWNQEDQTWKSIEAPPSLRSSLRFAGIGTRTLPAHAVDAARSIFHDLSTFQAKVVNKGGHLLVRAANSDDAAQNLGVEETSLEHADRALELTERPSFTQQRHSRWGRSKQ